MWGGTSSPCTGLCLLRIEDLAMGDCDCQRAAVLPSMGVRPLRDPCEAGSPLMAGASLLRQVAALVYLSGPVVRVASTLRFTEFVYAVGGFDRRGPSQSDESATGNPRMGILCGNTAGGPGDL